MGSLGAILQNSVNVLCFGNMHEYDVKEGKGSSKTNIQYDDKSEGHIL